MTEKKVNYTIIEIVLALAALSEIFVPQYHDIGALAIFGVVGYIALADVEAEWLADARIAYEMVRSQPALYGRLPKWDKISDHDLQIELEDFWMYIISFMWDGAKHYLTVNRHPTPERPLLLDFYDPHLNPLAHSTVRDMSSDKAFETVRNKQQRDMVHELTQSQYKERLRSKGILKNVSG